MGNVATGLRVDGTVTLDVPVGMSRFEITVALNSPEIIGITHPVANKLLVGFNLSGTAVTLTSRYSTSNEATRLVFNSGFGSNLSFVWGANRGALFFYDDPSVTGGSRGGAAWRVLSIL
jgi:hypothetical protein